MRSHRNKTFLLSVLTALLFSSLSFSVFSATPPTPSGYATGGLFSQYFKNIITSGSTNPSGVCPTGYGIVGFSTGSSNYGRPICTDGIGLWLKNGTSLYYNGGNIGIGTSTPSTKLDVAGTGTFWGVRIASGASNGFVLTSDASGNARWAASSFTESDPQVGTNTTNYLSKWNGTALITSQLFDNGTNVGVGTGTPSSKLEVVGSARLSAPAGGNVAFNIYTNAQTNNNITLGQGFATAIDNIGYLYNRANADFVLGTANTDMMWIKANGNIGIGTNSPASLLTLSGGSNNGLRINNGTVNGIVFNTSNASMSVGTVSNHPLGLYTNNTQQVTVSTGGNVGIGTVSPGAKLELLDTGASPTGIYLKVKGGYPGYSGSSGTSLAIQDKDNTSDFFTIKSDYSLDLRRFTSLGVSLSSFYVNSNGNVGIGTTTLTGTLTVSGTIAGLNRFGISYPTTGVYSGSNVGPYSRVDADSFHTNGLGVGQMFIEGRAIDSNGNIYIGMGVAGGQAASNILIGTGGALSIDTAGYASLTRSPTSANHLATKAYVDAQVGAAGGGLKLYNYDGVTLIGNFVAWNFTDYSIVYADTNGNLGTVSDEDRMTYIRDPMFKNATCTGQEFVTYNYANGNYTAQPFKSKTYGGNIYKHTTGPSCSMGSYGPIYRWNFTNSTCVLVSSSANYCSYNTPGYSALKACGAGDCKLKY